MVPEDGVAQDGLDFPLNESSLVEGGRALYGGELLGEDPVEGGDGDEDLLAADNCLFRFKLQEKKQEKILVAF